MLPSMTRPMTFPCSSRDTSPSRYAAKVRCCPLGSSWVRWSSVSPRSQVYRSPGTPAISPSTLTLFGDGTNSSPKAATAAPARPIRRAAHAPSPAFLTLPRGTLSPFCCTLALLHLRMRLQRHSQKSAHKALGPRNIAVLSHGRNSAGAKL